VRNSPKLITLHLSVAYGYEGVDVSLQEKFWNRKLFTAGHCKVVDNSRCALWVLVDQGTDLLPLWESELCMF